MPASLVPRADYVRALRDSLPNGTFARASSRLVFLPAYVAVVVVATLAVARGWAPVVTWPALALVIGMGFAGMTFVGHELLHGAIVRRGRLQHVLGWLAFVPFTLSPRLWCSWHNRVHHGHANHADDPDGYPMLEHYRTSRGARFAVDAFALGGRRWRGALSLVLGFTGQSASQLVLARGSGCLSAAEHRRACIETALAVGVWAIVAALVGPLAFVFVFVIPLLVANVCVMMFILTNHSLSPRVAIDDPLASGLTVTTPRIVEWLTLGFGFHVEHHLFPAMSTRHGAAVRALLQARWPERYRSMSLREALVRLHRSARVYKDASTLFDPRTGREHATL